MKNSFKVGDWVFVYHEHSNDSYMRPAMVTAVKENGLLNVCIPQPHADFDDEFSAHFKQCVLVGKETKVKKRFKPGDKVALYSWSSRYVGVVMHIQKDGKLYLSDLTPIKNYPNNVIAHPNQCRKIIKKSSKNNE